MTIFFIVLSIGLFVSWLVAITGSKKPLPGRIILQPEHFVPSPLVSRLIGQGFLPLDPEGKVIWLEAILYLWWHHRIGIVIYPITDMEQGYDFDIMSNIGEPWEKEQLFPSYQAAAEVALDEVLSDLESLKSKIS